MPGQPKITSTIAMPENMNDMSTAKRPITGRTAFLAACSRTRRSGNPFACAARMYGSFRTDFILVNVLSKISPEIIKTRVIVGITVTRNNCSMECPRPFRMNTPNKITSAVKSR